MGTCYYETLGVDAGATVKEIRDAYRKLARQHHPDKSGAGSGEEFAHINEAYETLSNEHKRQLYDDSLHTCKVSGVNMTEEPASGHTAVPVVDIHESEYLHGAVMIVPIPTVSMCRACSGVICLVCCGEGVDPITMNPCTSCAGGNVSRCPTCHGSGTVETIENVDFDIPPCARHGELVYKDGHRIQVRHAFSAGCRAKKNGDIGVCVDVNFSDLMLGFQTKVRIGDVEHTIQKEGYFDPATVETIRLTDNIQGHIAFRVVYNCHSVLSKLSRVFKQHLRSSAPQVRVQQAAMAPARA